MRALRMVLLAVATLAPLGGCARHGAEASAAARAPVTFTGRWSSDGARLPPVSLELQQDGATLRGRAFLSGVTFPVEGSVTGRALELRSTEEPAREIDGALGNDGVLRARVMTGRSVVRVELRRE